MYSLPTDSGLNGRAFRPLSSANKHKRTLSSVRGLQATHAVHGLMAIPTFATHTYRYASVHILAARLYTSLQLVHV